MIEFTVEKKEQFNEYVDNQNDQAVLQVNSFAKQVLEEICACIVPGVYESEVLNQTKEIYQKHNIDRIWHQPLIRFGNNTVLTVMEQAKQGIQQQNIDKQLQEEDIAFVDIGIVKNGIEGDVGKTLVFGNNKDYKKLADSTKELFDLARNYLHQHPTISGIELYEYIYKLTAERGYIFNLKNAGHLIGSFSHAAAKWRYGLNYYPHVVKPYRWILEIQIMHPQLNVGGFFEELLI